MLNSVGLQGPGVEAWLRDDLPRAAGHRRARSSPASGAASVDDYERAADAAGRRAGRGRRGRGQPVVPEPRGTAPTCSPTRRRPPRTPWRPPRGAAGRAGRSSAPTSPTWPTSRRPRRGAGPRRSRWSTPCSAWPSTSRPAGTGSANGGGGLSGPAIHPVAVRAVHDVHAALPGPADRRRRRRRRAAIDAVELLLAGASAVQVGTATFADPAASARVLTELGDWCRRHGVQALARRDRRDRMTDDAVTPMATRRPRCASRLALALDVDDLVAALRLARELQPWFGVAKVGLELFSAAGPDAIGPLVDLGFDVFLDLKLHDIPTTVEQGVAGARVRSASRYLTLHAHGGVDMLRAGVEGLRRGRRQRRAARADRARGHGAHQRRRARRRTSCRSGCSVARRGAAAAASCARRPTSPRSGSTRPALLKVVPGIRPAGAPTHDQARVGDARGGARRRAPTSSWSAARSPRPTIRSPRRPRSSAELSDLSGLRRRSRRARDRRSCRHLRGLR